MVDMVDVHGVHTDNCALKYDIIRLVPTCEFMYNSVTCGIIISLFYPIPNVIGKRHGTVPLILYGLHS